MILLDTHIWYWWVGKWPRLTEVQQKFIRDHESEGLGVSIISCWEVAQKAESGRLELDRPVVRWIENALAFPNIRLVNLSPEIVVESVQLPKPIHRDPADRIIVATARILDCPLMTVDGKLLDYPHVKATDGVRPLPSK